METTNPFHLFGIRHHGPGSARSLLQALEALGPDCVVIEGPPEAEALVSLISASPPVSVVASSDGVGEGLVAEPTEVLSTQSNFLEPPVALLGYVPKEPSRAIYYPLAVFSPEWQAMLYANTHQRPVRFMDLPWKHELALLEQENKTPVQAEADVEETTEKQNPVESDVASDEAPEEALQADPLTVLARAAGYDDTERFWEHWVEQRRDSTDLFAAVLEAMTALRQNAGPHNARAQRNAIREAFMRNTLRRVKKEGFQKIAVVCGAWHTPALVPNCWPSATEDQALLVGLPSAPVAVTWIPWTYGRLAMASGYGAGIEAPGWYDFLWHHLPTSTHAPSAISEGWLTQAARLLRVEGLEASSAQTVEAVRLADTLAALRGRPLPGLPELNDAILALFCQGNPLPLQLIQAKLLLNDRLGHVPSNTPSIPLQRDIDQWFKTVRLSRTVTAEERVLDLRKDLDLARSRFLHRLDLLGIPFGERQPVQGQGTFKEAWRLLWKPEFALVVIEVARFGTTLPEALHGHLLEHMQKTNLIEEITQLLSRVLLCDLQSCISPLVQRLQDLAALTHDIRAWAKAIPALVHIARYSDVRNTARDAVLPILDGMMARLCVQLPHACVSLNDEAAEDSVELLQPVHNAVRLLQQPAHAAGWQTALHTLAFAATTHGLLAGRSTRWLFEQDVLSAEEVAQRLQFALSTAAEPAQAAAWLEGLLKASAHLLLHDDALWTVVTAWLQELSPDAFLQVVPLIRRTTSGFSAPERRHLFKRAQQSIMAGTKPVPVETATTQRITPEQLCTWLSSWSRIVGVSLTLTAKESHERLT